MKKMMIAALLAALLLTGCASGVTTPTQTPTQAPTAEPTAPPTDPDPSEVFDADDFSAVEGIWASDSGTEQLEINSDGQMWYTMDSGYELRGYLKRVQLQEGDDRYEYAVRYEFYNDADELLEYYYVVSLEELISVNLSGEETGSYGPGTILAADAALYQGLWQFADGMIVEIKGGDWDLYHPEHGLDCFGIVVFTEMSALLEFTDGTVIYELYPGENGGLTDAATGEALTALDEMPEPEEPSVGDGYVDIWYTYGDLNAESLHIETDGTWLLYTSESAGEELYFYGVSQMLGDGSLCMMTSDGITVATANLSGDDLDVELTEEYKWLFEDYGTTSMWFRREASSQPLEGQGGA